MISARISDDLPPQMKILNMEFGAVYPAIYCRKPTSLHNVAFHWLTSEYMQLARGYMQLAAAGGIGATKCIFPVFLRRKILIVH